jgi:hypothetical protein
VANVTPHWGLLGFTLHHELSNSKTTSRPLLGRATLAAFSSRFSHIFVLTGSTLLGQFTGMFKLTLKTFYPIFADVFSKLAAQDI